eukprot:1902257-Rhodomonas_salina.2
MQQSELSLLTIFEISFVNCWTELSRLCSDMLKLTSPDLGSRSKSTLWSGVVAAGEKGFEKPSTNVNRPA